MKKEEILAKVAAQERLATITSSEKEVLDLVLDGLPNRVIAQELDVSVRTVESRRQRISQKMAVDSIVELVRKVDLARSN